MNLITKSKYTDGLQCPRYLWREFNDKDKIPPISISTQAMFDNGTKVGELATKLYPEGIDLSKEDFKENLTKTKEALDKKQPIFEAGFQSDNLFSRVDILEPIEDEWDIIEVKMGTKVKEINLHDVSFQKYCLEKEGLKVRKCFLMHLNNEYFKEGELDLKKLFIKEDVTSEVDELMNGIEERIENVVNIIDFEECPSIAHCKIKDPVHKCEESGCFDLLPENNVFQLYNEKKRSYILWEDGIKTIGDIPDDFKLTDKQQIQRDCEVKNKVHVHKESVKHFLNTLKYPLYYLDFETFSTPIPQFDGTKPYLQIPFQFSLHVQEKEGGETKHFEYLYSGKDDPRKEFILELKKVLGSTGTVVVYNQSFEISRLKELGKLFPEHQSWVEDTLGRIVDLLVPFRNFSYYNPIQKGSASIKKVLPALTGKSYEEMGISGGSDASAEYYKVTYEGVSGDKKKQVMDDLLKYCELDTLAEVLIVNRLRELV